MIRRYIVFALFLALAVTLAVSVSPRVKATGISGGKNPVSSVKFSHKLHITQVGAECITCHPAAEKSKLSSDNLSAGHDNCVGCHEEQVTNACSYCHTNPDNIQPALVVEREFRFSHEQHVAMKDVQCQTCHKGLEESKAVGAVPVPPMTTCTTCHNDRKVTNACESCHQDFASLIPAEHKRSDFIRDHREFARLGALDATCQTCHTETFCQQCHQTTGLVSFGWKDLVTEPRAKTSTQDSPEQMVLQGVHELNYRFTHGIDAKARQSDCASCHNAREFCVQCHQEGGNITQQRFKPASHSVAGFTTVGPGSGGGLHAQEARRDMERCVSCHDVEGRDPTCLVCHAGNGKVR